MPAAASRASAGAKRWNSSPTAVSPAAATAARHAERSAAGAVMTSLVAAQPRRSAVRCRPRIAAIIEVGSAPPPASKIACSPAERTYFMDAIVSPESQSVDRPGTRSAGAAASAAQPTALMANAIRALAMDAVQQANSGHPGAPMGMAEIAVALWGRHLRHNPKNPRWPGRDRFVLSNGHGSMLLYSLLHLTGYDLPLSELKSFRQLHSKTPGHPEFGVTPGVETTTGPLGQGFANAVGMAIAEKTLAAEFNRAGHTIIDHRTFVIVGDGCLMEGVSHEAASLAGRLGLGKLIAIYDDNGISIDGKVSEWFADDTPKRFEAYGWQALRDIDGHDPIAIDAALTTAFAETSRPSLLCCKTVIGRGAPTKQGHQDTHGAPLGAEEIARARAELDWSYAPFEVPATVAEAWDARRQGAALEADWNRRFERYQEAYPALAAELTRRLQGMLAAEFAATADALISACAAKGETLATRKASQNA